jgi:hypothetical protein
MRTKIIIIGIIVIGCFGFYACEQETATPELDKFMYVSLVGAKNNPSIKKLDLLSTADTTFYIAMVYGGTTNFEKGDITASLEVDRSLVEVFNEANFTDYQLLPEGAYSFDRTNVQIPNGKNASEPVELTVRISVINLSSEYILPVTIKSYSGELPLNEELKTLYLVFRADVDEDSGRERWTISGASSESGANVPSRAFDGNRATYWNSSNAGPMPQWFSVNMQGFKRVSGFTWVNRNELTSTAVPKHVKFETSMNGTDWTEALDVPEVSRSRVLQVFPLKETILAKFFRVTVVSNWANSAFTYIAEIDIYSGDAPVAEYDIQKYNWTIVSAYNEWQAGYEASRAIDGVMTNCWHTDPSINDYPYWFIVDFHTTLKINGLLFQNRLPDPQNDIPKHITVELSDDMVTWTKIIDIEELPKLFSEQTLPCDNVVNGRYLRFSILNCWSGGPWTYVGEISIY